MLATLPPLDAPREPLTVVDCWFSCFLAATVWWRPSLGEVGTAGKPLWEVRCSCPSCAIRSQEGPSEFPRVSRDGAAFCQALLLWPIGGATPPCQGRWSARCSMRTMLSAPHAFPSPPRALTPLYLRSTTAHSHAARLPCDHSPGSLTYLCVCSILFQYTPFH